MDEILEYLVIGRIGRAHGIRGEVGIQVLTDFPERFSAGREVFIGPEKGPGPVPLTIESSRPHKDKMLVRFEGTPDRTAAERLTDLYVFIPIDQAAALDEDSYYPHELIGLAARLTDGRALGQVSSLLQAGGNDVLVIKDPARRGELLVPLARPFIQEIDLEAGTLTVIPVEGLELGVEEEG